MRVLHVGKYYPPYAGGMERFLADLLPALQVKGIVCAAVVHAHGAESATRGKDENGLLVTRVPAYGKLLYAPISPAFPFELNRAIEKFKPDLLHLHMPNTSALWGLFLPSALKVPWVVHWHSDVVASKLDRRLALAYPAYRPFEQALLRRAKAIIATSPPYLEASAALASWQEKRLAVPLGLDASRYPPAGTEERQWAEGQWSASPTLRLLTVGRMTYYKGHEVLIRALAEQPKASLLLVGDGEKRAALESLVSKLGLQGRVRLLGHLPDAKVNALIETCDAFCLPSLERTEAFGMVLLEAMRYGRPVIASRIEGSGVPWVVNENETGLLCKLGDERDLAEKIGVLAADTDLRQEMGEAARRRFEQFFRIEAVAAQISAIYKGL